MNKTVGSAYNWKMMSLQKLCPSQRQSALEDLPGGLLLYTDPQGNCHCGEDSEEARTTHGGLPQLPYLPRLASRQRCS